jgi:hypothetical protein
VGADCRRSPGSIYFDILALDSSESFSPASHTPCAAAWPPRIRAKKHLQRSFLASRRRLLPLRLVASISGVGQTRPTTSHTRHARALKSSVRNTETWGAAPPDPTREISREPEKESINQSTRGVSQPEVGMQLTSSGRDTNKATQRHQAGGMSGQQPPPPPAGAPLDPQQPGVAVARWAEVIGRCMRELPGPLRPVLAAMWAEVRREVVRLCGLATADDAASEVSRATTAGPTLAMRAAFEQQLLAEAAQVREVSETIRALMGVPAAWAQERLQALVYPQRVVEPLGPDGCWVRAGDSGAEYPKLNLRNSPHPLRQPGSNRKFGFQPYIHQLVVAARGDAELLKKTSPGVVAPFEVSHLCHDKRCFNPAHIIVEPRALNEARNSCRRRPVLRTGSLTFHPCPHWDDDAWCGGVPGPRRQCVLHRSHDLSSHFSGHYLQATADGGFMVRED